MTYAFDVPSPELLARYLRGDITPDERARVGDWLAGDPTRATELEDLRAILAAASPASVWDLDRVWAGVERGIGRPRRAPRFTLSHRPSRAAGLRAAAVLLLAGAGLAAALILGPQAFRASPEIPSVVATARGQRLSMRLPDSTLVVLAPESWLEIAPDYGQPVRRLRLVGQAAFTVSHDERHPFVVATRDAVARDLGTYFSVSAYPDDSVARIAVAEGTVAVGRPGGTDSLVVLAGEVAMVGADGRLDVVREADLDRHFAWADGTLAFKETPLAEVAEQMARWYDIEVVLADESLRSKRVTVSFHGEPPAQALQLVAALVGLESVGQADRYTLRLRR